MTPYQPAVTVHLKHQSKFIIGILLVCAGVGLPSILDINDFGVAASLHTALHEADNSFLLVSALQLALLNALRCFPHYLGAFFVGESVVLYRHGQAKRWPGALLAVGLIVAVYGMIWRIHGIHYDFGVPALSLVTLQVVLWAANYAYVPIIRKIVMQIGFITAFQFLDIMPALSKLPFGRGETSQSIKLAALVLSCEDLLNGMCLLFFVLFLLMGLMMLLSLREENHLHEIAALKEEQERIKLQAALQEQENRTYQEMQHLVHDLKSPLTSIQNLVGVMQFGCITTGQEAEREYLSIIEQLVDNMSRMISEILYEDTKSLLSTSDVMTMVLAQVSVLPYAELVTVDNQVPDRLIRVNRIRFARAVVNLLNNAYNALPPTGGHITVTLSAAQVRGASLICLNIEDNGCGIPPETLGKVWNRGYSSHGSHGLGLSYVRSVVNASDGTIRLESQLEYGTKVSIRLPEGGLAEDGT